MARSEIATDSASALRDLTGDDATATFESDPKFVDSNPTASASGENVEVQRDTDDTEDSDEEEEDAADLEDEGVDEDDVDEEDEDDDEEDAEDDADEIAATTILRVDGLLGQEDELADAAKGRDRRQGDAERAQKQAKVDDGDDDAGDVAPGVDEESLDGDDLDTDQVATPQVGARTAAGPTEVRV